MKRLARLAVCGALSVAVALCARPAAAQDAAAQEPAQQLAAARELVMYANYRAALPAARAFLERTDLGAQDRNAGLELLAIVHLALRDERSARASLAELYGRDPGHRLVDPDASPVVQSAFARARESAQALAVTIEHAPPILERRGAPVIAARVLENASAVHEIRLAYRQQGETRFTTVVMPFEAAGEAEGRIPIQTDDDDAYTVEYYLEAIAPSSHVLGRSGAPDAPLSLEIPAAAVIVAAGPIGPAEPAPIVAGDDSGVIALVVVLGILVVGGGVGAGVGVYYGTQGPPDGSLGSVTLPLHRF